MGHIQVNKYMKRIGKREDYRYECGEGVQSVKYVLEECRFGSKARGEYEKGSDEGARMGDTLYIKEGVDRAVRIWYGGRKRWLENSREGSEFVD